MSTKYTKISIIATFGGVCFLTFSDFLKYFWRKSGINIFLLSGIRNQGSGIRDQGSEIRDQGIGIREQGSGYRDHETVN